MIPVEIVWNVESPRYVIIDKIIIDGTGDFVSVLILNEDIDKYNSYIISTQYPFPRKKNAESIVETYSPLNLEMAKMFFPKYELNDFNYGF